MCDPIEGLAIPVGNDEVLGMTSLVGDAAICADTPAVAFNNYTIKSTEDVQSIKDYFSRPTLISSGNVTSGVGRLYFNYIGRDCGFIDTYFGANSSLRLTGIAGMRFTVRLTLQVTATPFHQGILCLSSQYSNTQVSANDQRSAYNPMSVNIPHVLLDIAESTSVSLDIPYISPYEYNPLPASSGLVGYHLIMAINRLTDVRIVAGQGAPTYNLYMSLHDIELIGVYPTLTTTVNIQSGVGAASRGKAPVRPSAPLATSSSKVTQESHDAGLVSGVLNTVADTAAAASMVPGLSSIGGAAEWFLRGSAGALASFGFSKPKDETIPGRMMRQNYAGDSQVDMPEVGYVVGPTQSNAIAVTSVLGCNDQDEMNFNHILSIPNIIFRGNLSSSATKGDAIYLAHVGPSFCWYRDFASAGTPTGNIAFPSQATLTTNVFLPSTLLYLGSQFRQWRGSLRYTFKFSKSKLHGARVLVSFQPYTTVAAANAPLGNTVYVPDTAGAAKMRVDGFSTIIDIRDQSTFDFVVPYTYALPYCAFNNAIGSISMQVLDKLVTSSVLSSSIDFLVFVSAEPDFEFAGVAPSTLDGVSGTGSGTAVLQSGIGGSDPVADSSQHVVGEHIKSVKQLIMIPDFNATVNTVAGSYSVWDADPWFKSNKFNMSIPMGNGVTALFYASKCGRLAQMYAFAQGSTKYVVMQDAYAAGSTIVMRQYPADCGQGPVAISDLYDRDSNPYGGVVVPESAGVGRYILPLYSKVARIPVSEASVGRRFGTYRSGFEVSGGNYEVAFTQVKYQLSVRNGTAGVLRFMVGIAAADDARLACFIGPPATIIFPSTSTAGPTNPGTDSF